MRVVLKIFMVVNIGLIHLVVFYMQICSIQIVDDVLLSDGAREKRSMTGPAPMRRGSRNRAPF
jgi:hypothetical protein